VTIEAARAEGAAGSAAIAAGSSAAADAGAALLAAGGSAVDAVIAAALAASVSEPGLTSLAGGGFLMVHAPDGTTSLIDFFVAVPGSEQTDAPRLLDDVLVRYSGAEQVFRIGPGSVAVPGCLDGLIAAHDRWGRRPIADVAAPAQDLARRGVTLEAEQAHVLDLISDVLAHTEESRRLFTDNGRPRRAGDRIALPDLANLLARIGSGEIRSFAHPDLAGPLVDLCGSYGPFSLRDVQAYDVIDRDPLAASLTDGDRTAELLTNAAPSFGGSIVVEALVDVLARGADVADLPVAVLRATSRVKARRESGRDSVRGTTHASAVDAKGWIAAMTTSNGSCSGVVLPGFGLQLNNMMGETDLMTPGVDHDEPGVRLRSMMAPSIVRRSDGAVAGLGSGGSERIRSAMSMVILHLARGWSLADAIGAPRMHADDAGTLHVEPGLDSEVVLEAERKLGAHANGAIVNHWPQHDFFFGGVNGVMRRADGSVEAAADARRGGAVVVVPASD
jgi:gamma-glutamyltranspeptidase/glutathione hydrolase